MLQWLFLSWWYVPCFCAVWVCVPGSWGTACTKWIWTHNLSRCSTVDVMWDWLVEKPGCIWSRTHKHCIPLKFWLKMEEVYTIIVTTRVTKLYHQQSVKESSHNHRCTLFRIQSCLRISYLPAFGITKALQTVYGPKSWQVATKLNSHLQPLIALLTTASGPIPRSLAFVLVVIISKHCRVSSCCVIVVHLLDLVSLSCCFVYVRL